MNRRLNKKLVLLLFLFALFSRMEIHRLYEAGVTGRLKDSAVGSEQFRGQEMNPKLISLMQEENIPVKAASVYLLETDFGSQKWRLPYTKQAVERRLKDWSGRTSWDSYYLACRQIWEDVRYFPVPDSTVNKSLETGFDNGWMDERSYGGKRRHEGTDIMTSENQPGLYPALSMTDGTVTNIGWLEKGGYRVGITAPNGGYFYYAHLDSYADIHEGDTIRAGDLIGFVGDSGYGPEGTKGMFATHLHVGIYLYPEGNETSINPYWVLKYLEGKKLKYNYS